MWDPTPWVIGGGAEHSPEVARVLAYAATGGAEGIVEPESCKITATPSPSGSIRTLPGAALIRNRYAGGAQQTYAVRNAAAHNTSVTPTGAGSGRTDLVIARVLDPQYEGQAPADPTDFQYVYTDIVTGVPSGTRTARELNLGYPAIELARLNLPANTTTVTNAMITDLRKVAQPRRFRDLLTRNLTGPDVHALTSTASGGQFWPDTPEDYWYVDVPEWATTMKVVVLYGGVRVSYSGASGVWWLRLGHTEGWGQGHVRTDDQKWALDTSVEPGREVRETWKLGETVAVPEALRGTRQPIRVMGKMLQTGGPPRLDNASSITIDYEFVEGAA